MRVIVPLAARGADRVITISDAAAADIAARLSVPPERIDVTHLGGRPVGPATPEPELRRRLGLTRRRSSSPSRPAALTRTWPA